VCDPRPPRAILFDIGDTVLREQSFNLRDGLESVLSFANHRTTDVDTLLAELDSEIARRHAEDRELSIAAWLESTLDLRLPVEDIEDVLWRATVRLVPAPGISACLTRLASDRLPIAAVSNASFSGRVIAHELDAHGLADHFAFVLTSADLGHRKPSAAIFDRALDSLGVDASDVWFVGDTWHEDIIGAHAAGLVPFWLSSSTPPSDTVVPATIVADWASFLECYRTANRPRPTHS
jgi:HAD superfamily hydrolase (TIGR01509 family)